MTLFRYSKQRRVQERYRSKSQRMNALVRISHGCPVPYHRCPENDETQDGQDQYYIQYTLPPPFVLICRDRRDQPVKDIRQGQRRTDGVCPHGVPLFPYCPYEKRRHGFSCSTGRIPRPHWPPGVGRTGRGKMLASSFQLSSPFIISYVDT